MRLDSAVLLKLEIERERLEVFVERYKLKSLTADRKASGYRYNESTRSNPVSKQTDAGGN